MTRAGVAIGLVVLLACGAERPPPEGSGAIGGPASGGGGFDVDAGVAAPPGCGSLPDGSTCQCLDAPLFVDAPTLYFVLDRSGSMRADNRWDQVRVTVGQILRGLGPRANFGAAMFPGQGGDDSCMAGSEVMSVRPGDPATSGGDGPTTTLLLNVTRVNPGGGTPTASTLELARTKLAGVQGRSFVILATDGAPNCNDQATCGFNDCQPNIEDFPGCPKEGPANCCEPPNGSRENCNDRSATVGAITALKNAGVPTYVLGLPGSTLYSDLLDEMAAAGGTALPTHPQYFAVSTSNQAAILAQLKKIAAQIAGTCTFDLKEAPTNAEFVNVYMDDVVLPYEPVNGWTIEGKTVTLVGAACNRVKTGDVLSVRIISGCPRVEPR